MATVGDWSMFVALFFLLGCLFFVWVFCFFCLFVCIVIRAGIDAYYEQDSSFPIVLHPILVNLQPGTPVKFQEYLVCIWIRRNDCDSIAADKSDNQIYIRGLENDELIDVAAGVNTSGKEEKSHNIVCVDLEQDNYKMGKFDAKFLILTARAFQCIYLYMICILYNLLQIISLYYVQHNRQRQRQKNVC